MRSAGRRKGRHLKVVVAVFGPHGWSNHNLAIFTIMSTWKRRRELLMDSISTEDPERHPRRVGGRQRGQGGAGPHPVKLLRAGGLAFRKTGFTTLYGVAVLYPRRGLCSASLRRLVQADAPSRGAAWRQLRPFQTSSRSTASPKSSDQPGRSCTPSNALALHTNCTRSSCSPHQSSLFAPIHHRRHRQWPGAKLLIELLADRVTGRRQAPELRRNRAQRAVHRNQRA
jgi:hypothetical protein